MSFELKQTITQIIAFLIMLWILNRYTWKPLLALLDERSRKIRDLFSEAEDKNREADLKALAYDKKIREIKTEGQVLIQKAITDANRISDELRAQAQNKAQQIIQKGHEQSERDLQKARVEFKKDMVEVAFSALEKLIQVRLNKEERDAFALKLLDDI